MIRRSRTADADLDGCFNRFRKSGQKARHKGVCSIRAKSQMMASTCELCENEEANTTLTFFGEQVERIPVCAGCQLKAQARDPETWDNIHKILRGE